MENSFKKLVDKSVDEAFRSLDVDKTPQNESEIKERLKKKVEKVLEEENCIATVKIVADDKKTVEKVSDLIKFVEHASNTGGSKSILVEDSAGEREWVLGEEGKIVDVNVEYHWDWNARYHAIWIVWYCKKQLRERQIGTFAEDIRIYIDVSKTRHAKRWQDRRDTKITDDEIVATAETAGDEIMQSILEGHLDPNDEVLIRDNTYDLNLVCKLVKESDNEFTLKVITVMIKKNFRPKSGTKVVDIY